MKFCTAMLVMAKDQQTENHEHHYIMQIVNSPHFPKGGVRLLNKFSNFQAEIGFMYVQLENQLIDT